MRAFGGLFWVNPRNETPATGCGTSYTTCPPGNETVLFVDKFGQAWLDSTTPQQIYLNTQTGALQYLSSVSTLSESFAAGAMVTNFLHLGSGTAVSVPIQGEPVNEFANPGPGSFQWVCLPFHSSIPPSVLHLHLCLPSSFLFPHPKFSFLLNISHLERWMRDKRLMIS